MPRLPAGRKSVAVSIALIGAVAAGTAGVFAVPPAAAETSPTTDKLGDHDRALIAQYARQRATRRRHPADARLRHADARGP